MDNWKKEPYLVKDFKAYNAARPKPLQFITPEEYQVYTNKVAASKGFDVENCPGFMVGKIAPLEKGTQEWRVAEKVTVVAAIDVQEELEHPPLTSVKLLKANNQAVGGLIYYLTFEAVDATSVKAIYKAKVWAKPSRVIQTLSFIKNEENEITMGCETDDEEGESSQKENEFDMGMSEDCDEFPVPSDSEAADPTFYSYTSSSSSGW